MIKSLLCFCAVLFSTPFVYSQTLAEKEISETPNLATGKYMAYVAPLDTPTPAPEGYEPCYISTYARHGSRYLTGEDKYEPALNILEKDYQEDGLTKNGKKT